MEENLFGDELTKRNPMITIFTSEKNKLNKLIKNDGTKHANALFYKGKYETVRIDSLKELEKIIMKIKPTQAIGLGINKYNEKGNITSWSEDPEKARSKDNFKWPNSKKIVLLDYDYFNGLKECNSPSEYRDLLISIEPEFKQAQMLIMTSSSSGIYKDNKLFMDSKGLHCYMIIDGDINEFKNKLWATCWAKGLGAIKIAKDGSVLPRTIFDKAVFSPERLIFESLPDLENGLIQTKREIFYTQGLCVSPRNMEKNFESGHKNEIDAKNNAKGLSKEIADAYKKDEIDKLIAQGISSDEAEKIVTARTGEIGSIYSTDFITLSTGKKIQACKLSTEHNGLYCLDPIEPEAANAIINISEDGITKNIWSFLHGGKLFDIVEPNDDVQLQISEKATQLADGYKNRLWLNKFGFTTNDKLYENWEIMFQSYIDASQDDFRNKMHLIGAGAGNGKSTSLGYYIAKEIIPDENQSVLVVVNTIRNARELQIIINEMIPSESTTKAVVLHSSDGKKIDGATEKSDIKEDEAQEHRVLIITHAKLQLAVRHDDTDSIRCVKDNGILKERNLTVVDEAIDFAETATIRLLHINLCITYLDHILSYKKLPSAKKLRNVLKRISERNLENSQGILQPYELFGKENLNLTVDEEVIIELEKQKQTEFNIKSFIGDLEILSRADGFVMDIGGKEGVMYSSSKDKLPSGKGIVILDASATINNEYKHYITNKKAERIRINQDARSYANVTIYTAVTRDSVGKINVSPTNDMERYKLIERQEILIKEIFKKTTEDDKVLVIGNMDFINLLADNSFGGRNVKCEYWNNLTGRNDLRDCNKVFVVTLPFKPIIHKNNLAHKHGLFGNETETTLFQYSNIADDIYQAIMRANLRTTLKHTTDAPKCDVYLVLPARKGKLRNLIKRKISSLLVDCNWSTWKQEVIEGRSLFNTSPSFHPSDSLKKILVALEQWNKHNDKSLFVTVDELSTIADMTKNSIRVALSRKVAQAYDEDYTGASWIEDQNGEFTYFKSSDSNTVLKNCGVKTKGKGQNIFIRNTSIEDISL